MGAVFDTIKWFVFALNILCLFLGVGDIYVNAIGVEEAQPGTDAHASFILAILLCSLLCLTTVIGCYGVFSESFAINVIYSTFILALMIIQYIQIRSFQPQEFYFTNLQELESAWRVVETHRHHMDDIQRRFNCCGLFNASDYSSNHLAIPESCVPSSSQVDNENLKLDLLQINNQGCLEAVWQYYKFAEERHVLFDWALLFAEFITIIYSITLNILILQRRTRPRFENLHRAVAREFAQHNHIGSRLLLQSH